MNVGLAKAIAMGVGARAFSRRARVCLLSVSALLCACLAWSASADALSQRGHVFTSAIGTPGSGDGQLSQPGQLAVNETTGDVYVVDKGNGRIERFAADGTFISAWGEGTLNNPGAIAVDNSSSPSAGDVYAVTDANLNGGKLVKFNAAGEKLGTIKQEGESAWEGAVYGVALDASGNLWVYRTAEEPTEGYVEGFDGKERLSAKQKKEAEEKGEGEGKANEYRGLALEPFLEGPALEARRETESSFCPRPGFGVDAGGAHFVIDHEIINTLEACSSETIKEEEEQRKEEHSKEPPSELLHKVNPALFVFNAGEELLEAQIGSLNGQDTRAVAVDQASGAATPLGEIAKGDSYFASGGTFAAANANGERVERVPLPGNSPLAGGVAINSKTGDVYVTDTSNGQVDVFAPTPDSAPTVDSAFPQVTSTSTKIVAQIDPRNASSDTHVLVQYGTQSCVTDASACADVPAAPGATLARGFGDQTFEATLEGLQPDTTYYYRVLAQNAAGKGESAESATTFFTTLPSAQAILADHRSWEMVSPPAKGGILSPILYDGAAFQASEDGNAFTYGTEKSAPTGETQGNRSIAVIQFLSTRGEQEWATQNLTTPHNKGEGLTAGSGETDEYRLFSSDLSLGLVEPEIHAHFSAPVEEPPLSPPAAGETREKTMYLRADAPVSPGASEQAIYDLARANHEYLEPGYLPLVTGASNTGEVGGVRTKYGEDLNFADGTSDLNHVVFEAHVPLVSGFTGEGQTGEGLYEWGLTAGQPSFKLVSVLPGSEGTALSPHLGGPSNPQGGGAELSGNSRNAISSDGSRVIFTSSYASEEGEENQSAFLFTRDTVTGETVQVNKVQGEHVIEPTVNDRLTREVDETAFQAASSDGSKVFFTDTWPLTDSSTLHPTVEAHPADLYEYDLDKPPGERLTDLTVDDGTGESADVLGVIPGASEDGSFVYFVANGVLAPGASPGHCPEQTAESASAEATCNLYVSEPSSAHPGEREVRLIGILSADDAADWDRGHLAEEHEYNLSKLTARVSPGDGEFLTFMSSRKLTAYDNTDANSGAQDEEVYLYDTTRGRLVCASCNPSGARPQGVLDTENSGEGRGLLVDRPTLWEGSWLAGSIPGWTTLSEVRSIYQSRYLSGDGRLFFNSPDKLVSQDKNSKEDVYEYEPEGVGDCASVQGCVSLISSGAESAERESAFLDATPSGNDVYFLSSVKLLPQDLDTTFDVYDARVCGTSESSACLPVKPPPPPPCVGEACKAGAPAPPAFGTGATATFSGPGNTPATGVLPSKSKAKAKPLTRAQKLAKALKACKKLKKKKRAACQRQAHKRYGPKKKAKKKAKKASSRTGASHAHR